MEYWLAAEIYNVDNNIEVKVVVIFKGELKLARGPLVYLAVVAVFYKMFNCLNLNFIACSLKNPKQLINGWVAKIMV